MATIDARWKLLGQAGALSQVRAYDGILIRKEPLGKSPLGSESSAEIVINSRHLFTSFTLWQCMKFPDVCTPKMREKQWRCVSSFISCLYPGVFVIDVYVFTRGRYICLYQTAFAWCFDFFFWGGNLLRSKETNEKKRNKKYKRKKRRGLLRYQTHPSSQTVHLFLSSSFQERRRKWFYYIATFSLNCPLWVVDLIVRLQGLQMPSIQ